MIELMVTVAIVAILAAVAYPSYTSHMRKGRRPQAQSFLMDLAQREQQYFTDSRSYALDSGNVKALSAANPFDVESRFAALVPGAVPPAGSNSCSPS